MSGYELRLAEVLMSMTASQTANMSITILGRSLLLLGAVKTQGMPCDSHLAHEELSFPKGRQRSAKDSAREISWSHWSTSSLLLPCLQASHARAVLRIGLTRGLVLVRKAVALEAEGPAAELRLILWLDTAEAYTSHSRQIQGQGSLSEGGARDPDVSRQKGLSICKAISGLIVKSWSSSEGD